MLEPDFVERLGEHLDETNQFLSMYGAPMVNPVPVLEDYRRYAARIAPFVADTSAEVAPPWPRVRRCWPRRPRAPCSTSTTAPTPS